MPVNPMLMKVLSRSHTFWYRLTAGIIGSSMMGTPVLLLTHTGRRSGRRITTPLQYISDGENFVLIASNAGHTFHPQWYLNLKADPDAEVQIKSDVRKVRAEEVAGEERDRLWQKAVDQYSGYADYQKTTGGRQIPVMVLRAAA
jgi:deazaflavin-dependent oxidoreductase (nitroreductase family)